jgi:hypothetical protein
MAITCSLVRMNRFTLSVSHTSSILDSSNLQIAGSSARLVSTFEPNNQGRCLEFWYYRFGAATGSFNVYITTNLSDNVMSIPVWSRKASTWDYWRKAQIPTEHSASFRAIFESVTGDSKEVKIVANHIDASLRFLPHREMLPLMTFDDCKNHAENRIIATLKMAPFADGKIFSSWTNSIGK